MDKKGWQRGKKSLRKWSLVQTSSNSSKVLAKVAAESSNLESNEEQGEETLSTENENPEGDSKNSSLNVTSKDRKKSGQGRRKSAARMADVGKAMAMKRLMGSVKSEKQPEEPEVRKNAKIWDKQLEKLALRKKTRAQIEKEIGPKQVCVIPATPTVKAVAVKHKIKPVHTLKPLVLRPARPNAKLLPISHRGPRHDVLGNIIPHSILGDVDSFLKHSKAKIRKSDFLLVHPAQSTSACKLTPTEDTDMFCNPYLNESHSLKTWADEMALRQEQQQKLAGLLNRKESALLMFKSDKLYQADRQMRINYHQRHDPSNHEDVCFWRLGQKCTANHLQETLSKSARGQFPVPEVCVDSDAILKEKGKDCTYDETKFHDGCADQGIIHNGKKVIFNDLLLIGEQISSDQQLASGDNLEHSKGVSFSTEQRLYTENITQGGRNSSMEKSNLTCEQKLELRKDGQVPDKVLRRSKDCRGIFDFRFMRKNSERYNGPALVVGGTPLKWCCEGRNVNCSCSNKTNIESLVLICGKQNEVNRGFAKLENIGSTAIRYFWIRIPESKSFPIPKPSRRYFYFMDNEGIILPDETVYIPMLFRSPVPGYFTESWYLTTQPTLEGRAKIKYTFTALAESIYDFSQQIQEIQENLTKQTVENICSWEVKSIVDYAALKASLLPTDREDVVEPTREEIFVETNPGMYYHGHIVIRLQELYQTFISQSNCRADDQCPVVSVYDLRKEYLLLPEVEIKEGSDDSEEKENQTDVLDKQDLLRSLNQDINILCYKPLFTWQPKFEMIYLVMYSALQSGVDNVVRFASTLVDSLQILPVKETKENDSVKTQGKNKGKSKGASKSSRNSRKDLQPDVPDISTPAVASEEVPVFSAVQKFRAENGNTSNPLLQQYDEKVYLEMYRMLQDTVEGMLDIYDLLSKQDM